MASMAMAAASSYMGGSATVSAAKPPSTGVRRGMVVVRASSEKTMAKAESNINSGRRDLMFGLTAAAAAAVCSVAVAVAEEPKQGTLEAKKKYAPVCVTMPTARICHK